MCVYVSDLLLYFISHADTLVFDKLQPWKPLKKILCLSPCCNCNKEGLTFYKNNYGSEVAYINDMIYLLTAVGLTPGGSSTVHIYTQTMHGMIQNKQYIEQHNNFGRYIVMCHLNP
jgi:hypothetical protein